MNTLVGLAQEENDKYLFFLGENEIKQLHTLMGTRPLGFLDELRKDIERAYDDINSKASEKEREA